MAINLAKRASDKVVERFRLGSCTEGIFSTRYKWTGVATVQVFSVDRLPLQDYDKAKADGSRFGTLTELGDTVQELTVGDDKAFNGSIDKGNNTAQMMIKSASSVLRRQTDEVIIPYVDKYRLKKLAEGAGLTGTNVTLTDENALEVIMKAGAEMSNAKVPREDRVIYIGETNAIKVKLQKLVLGVDRQVEEALVAGVCGTIDGMQVRVVPDDYMPENVVFMIVHKGCAVAPKKIETYRVLEEHPDIDGAVVQGRLLHDCFVLEAVKEGIYAAKSTAE